MNILFSYENIFLSRLYYHLDESSKNKFSQLTKFTNRLHNAIQTADFVFKNFNCIQASFPPDRLVTFLLLDTKLIMIGEIHTTPKCEEVARLINSVWNSNAIFLAEGGEESVKYHISDKDYLFAHLKNAVIEKTISWDPGDEVVNMVHIRYLISCMNVMKQIQDFFIRFPEREQTSEKKLNEYILTFDEEKIENFKKFSNNPSFKDETLYLLLICFYVEMTNKQLIEPQELMNSAVSYRDAHLKTHIQTEWLSNRKSAIFVAGAAHLKTQLPEIIACHQKYGAPFLLLAPKYDEKKKTLFESIPDDIRKDTIQKIEISESDFKHQKDDLINFDVEQLDFTEKNHASKWMEVIYDLLFYELIRLSK